MFAYNPRLAMLAFPSSHGKSLTCWLAVLSHRTLHASKASTERAFAWTSSGLWSLEVGAGSPIVFFSTGCSEPSLAARVFSNLKGDVSFTYSFTCHYPPLKPGSRGLDFSNLNLLRCFINGLVSVSSMIPKAST